MYPLASAARETARYPENSLSPMASPRRCGPTRSIFMMTVVDQQSPRLIPRRKLATVIHPQDGAHIKIKGTGRPTIQPPTRSAFRPIRSENLPAARLVNALTNPNPTMNERMTLLETRPNSRSAIRGRMARSRPTIPPTKAVTRTRSENWARFSRRPRTGAGSGKPGVPPYSTAFPAAILPITSPFRTSRRGPPPGPPRGDDRHQGRRSDRKSPCRQVMVAGSLIPQRLHPRETLPAQGRLQQIAGPEDRGLAWIVVQKRGAEPFIHGKPPVPSSPAPPPGRSAPSSCG